MFRTFGFSHIWEWCGWTMDWLFDWLSDYGQPVFFPGTTDISERQPPPRKFKRPIAAIGSAKSTMPSSPPPFTCRHWLVERRPGRNTRASCSSNLQLAYKSSPAVSLHGDVTKNVWIKLSWCSRVSGVFLLSANWRNSRFGQLPAFIWLIAWMAFLIASFNSH